MCNRSGGLIARAIEEAGISTVVVMMHREAAGKLKPPHAALVRFPFGRPFGLPGAPDQQRVVVEDALSLLMEAKEPGQILALPYRWRREDYASIRALPSRHFAPFHA